LAVDTNVVNRIWVSWLSTANGAKGTIRPDKDILIMSPMNARRAGIFADDFGHDLLSARRQFDGQDLRPLLGGVHRRNEQHGLIQRQRRADRVAGAEVAGNGFEAAAFDFGVICIKPRKGIFQN
jgi:hypothetical protein